MCIEFQPWSMRDAAVVWPAVVQDVSLGLSGNFKDYLLSFLLCFSGFCSVYINICFFFYLAFFSESVA